MKRLLVPVDFSPLCEGLMDFVAAMNKDLQFDEVILVKAFYLSGFASVMPSPDGLLMEEERIREERDLARGRVSGLATYLLNAAGTNFLVRTHLIEEDWTVAIKLVMQKEEPDLLVIGHDQYHLSKDDVLSDKVVAFAQQSVGPVLLVPYGAVYHHPQRILIPLALQNLERLSGFKKLFEAKLWRSITITALHVNKGQEEVQLMAAVKQDLNGYLTGFSYEVVHMQSGDIPRTILDYVETQAIDLIFALPGHHSILHALFHHSVTKRIALNSQKPVLLLK